MAILPFDVVPQGGTWSTTTLRRPAGPASVGRPRPRYDAPMASAITRHVTFAPTPEQVRFRDLARHRYDDGERAVAAWCRATILEAWDRPITAKVFRDWEDTPGFLDWFEEVVPEVAPITLTDQAILMTRFWEALGRGLDKGDQNAVRTVADLIKVQQLTRMQSDPALEAWLNAPVDKIWLQPVGDAK